MFVKRIFTPEHHHIYQSFPPLPDLHVPPQQHSLKSSPIRLLLIQTYFHPLE